MVRHVERDLLFGRERHLVSEPVAYELWCIASGNLLDYTDDLHRAGEFWRETLTDPTLAMHPDIDCEGDCCAYGECRFGLVGGPSASSPPELEDD